MKVLPTVGIIAVEVSEEQSSLIRGIVISKGPVDETAFINIPPNVGDDVLFGRPTEYMEFMLEGRKIAFIFGEDLVAVLEK